jgi:hypothetical protein
MLHCWNKESKKSIGTADPAGEWDRNETTTLQHSQKRDVGDLKMYVSALLTYFYLRTRLFSDLCYAIDLAKEVISRTDTHDQRLGRRLVDIRRAYIHQSPKGGKGCVQLALESAERAFQATSPDQIDRSRALKARATALGARYINEKDDEDNN